MAILLVAISPQEMDRIEMLVKGGNYRDVEQFLAAAIRNQLAYERSDISTERYLGDKLGLAQRKDIAASSQLDAFTRIIPNEFEGEIGVPSEEPIWGQYYRFLPVKAVLRLAVGEFGGRHFTIGELSDIVRENIMSLVDYCEHTGITSERNIKLQVGFPSAKRDLTKSMERFVVQYVGRFSGAGKLTGFPSDMGFVMAERSERQEEVQLTRQAVEFASLSNPILDQEKGNGPLGTKETRYILKHIRAAMPGETAQIGEIIHLLKGGVCTPTALDDALEPFYAKAYSNDASGQERSLMRSGCVSRLIEMGVVNRGRERGNVVYTLTSENENPGRGILHEFGRSD